MCVVVARLAGALLLALAIALPLAGLCFADLQCMGWLLTFGTVVLWITCMYHVPGFLVGFISSGLLVFGG